MKPDTRRIAALAGALATLGNECQQLRGSVTRLGTGPDGFEGDVAYMRRASDALCQMSRIERARLTDPSASVSSRDEERIRCELRTHLGTLKGYGELILEDVAADIRVEVADDTEELLRDIVDRANALLPLVDRLRRTRPEPQPEPQPEPEAPKARRALEGVRVLVIDDDPKVRQTLLGLFGEYAVECVAVSGGKAGLRTLEQEEFDVVLCGVTMAEMSGAEVLRALKAESATAELPVLMLASASEDAIVAKCLASGAVDFITTPVRPLVLVARLTSCLAARKVAEAQAELEAAIESMSEGFAVYDRSRRLRSCNQTYRELNPGLADLQTSEIRLEQVLRANWDRGIYSSGSGDEVPDFGEWCQLRVERHDSARPHMERLGGGRWIESVHNKMPTGGTVVHQKEVTARQREEERLRYLLFHDPLTALPNAAMFELQVRHAIDEGAFAMLVVELDGWKALRVARGTDAANAVLKSTAESLLDGVRAGDLVAHLGGESFAMLLYRVKTDDRAIELAGRICEGAKQRLEEETAGVIGVRVGLALCPVNAREHALLLDIATSSLARI